MQVELFCSNCCCRFAAPPETSSQQVLDRMTEEGPWYYLGEGQTFEDMIFTTLAEEGSIFCPECGDPVEVSEESLGRMALEMLHQW